MTQPLRPLMSDAARSPLLRALVQMFLSQDSAASTDRLERSALSEVDRRTGVLAKRG